MNTDQNNYQKLDDQQQSPSFQSMKMNSEENLNSLTSSHDRERISSLIVIGFLGILTGMAYPIVIPTAWGYINMFVSEKNAGLALGLVFSVSALSSAITGIVFGYLYDIGVSFKRLILFGSIFQIIGNVFYFIGINIYVVLTSRLIIGVGLGIMPLLLADVSRRSTPETRTQLLTKILFCQQIGVILGPLFTLFLVPLNFSMFGLTVTVYNAPGLLMAVLWFIAGIVTICFFHDLPVEILVPKSVSEILPAYSFKDVCIRICHICHQPVLIVLLIATFIDLFSQTALETALTPFTSYQFNWSSFQVSILCVIAGVEVIVVYIPLYFVTKKFRDQTILLFGYIILSIACLIAAIVLPLSVPGSDKYLSVFLLFVFLDIFAFTFVRVTNTSLFSQETKDEQQGIGQGIKRAVIDIAAICGPLYAGALLGTLRIMFLSLLIFVVIGTILIGIVYPSFRPKTTDESSSLISHANSTASSVEESNYESLFQNEFIWECQTNADPWDTTQTPKWTPYSYAKSFDIEEAYKNKSKEIFIDANYLIDLKNYIQQHIKDPYRQRPVRRRRCCPPSTVSNDEETEGESAHRKRLSFPLGLALSCSATGDTTYYGSSFVHTWLLNFTEGKMKITFGNIYPVLLKGLIHEGNIAKTDKLSEIKAMLNKVVEETRGKRSEKRIRELQKCCAELYVKPSYIYFVVNTALRDNDQNKLISLGPFCYLLFNYIGRRFNDNSSIRDRFGRILHRNKIESMILYRGDNNSDSIIEEYRRAAGDNSKNFKWLPFVSTSRDQEVAELFTDRTVLYIIEIRSYSLNEDRFKDLSEISPFKDEKEILLLPGVQFQVNKVEFDNEKGLHLVYIKINSSYISKLK